jgi:Pyridoxal-phosphate dependent enzyme
MPPRTLKAANRRVVLVLHHDLTTTSTPVTATRGNHGQSLAFAGARAGVTVTIVVPHGNSIEKNAAMRAFGAELIEHGRDFVFSPFPLARHIRPHRSGHYFIELVNPLSLLESSRGFWPLRVAQSGRAISGHRSALK